MIVFCKEYLIQSKSHNNYTQMKSNILIAGSGGIGQAAGLILAHESSFDCNIFFGDRYESSAISAVNFVHEGINQTNISEAFVMPETGVSDQFVEILEKSDIILDCLPGSQAPRLAELARQYNLHYANLTEYVAETDQVTKIAKGADTGFILQTGLAPGFINVLAMKLFNSFCEEFAVEKVDKVEMRVGAISDHARSPHFYAFTWSPIGVATEYVKEALVVRNYEKISVPSLSETETIIIDGFHYEDDFTSGGAADLPEALAGLTKELAYKTLRHPGHYNWVKQILDSVPPGQDKITYLEKTMLSEIPSVEDDNVIIFANVIGKDSKGILRSKEKSYSIKPAMLGNKKLRAIQTTTASALCEAARMLLTGKYKGPVFQSQIEPDDFLNGIFVKQFYGGY